MRKIYIKLLISTVVFLICFIVNSQTKAITEDGDTIYVYDNGTWSFEKLEQMPEANELAYLTAELKIDTLSNDFVYSKNANKQVSNSHNQFIIKYDDNQWKRVPPATLNDDAEFAFQSKDSDIWCVVISEETPIEPDKLYRIALKTIERKAKTKAEIVKTELRKVNGNNVIRGVSRANFSGITFIFDSYYFSNDKGSVQFTTWTSEKVWERTEDKIINLLNGFIVNQNN